MDARAFVAACEAAFDRRHVRAVTRLAEMMIVSERVEHERVSRLRWLVIGL